MFYVSISATAIEKIKEHANKNINKEVIGLLIGRMEGNTLIVEDSVTGEIVSERTRALIVPETIAKIADEIVSGKIKGNVVGWYHSHPGFGVFMSEIDIKTQMKMQQFSPYIVALIIDPTKDEMGLFTLDINTRTLVTLTEDFIHIYAPGEEPIPPKFIQPSPPQFFYSPTYPFVTKPPVEKAKKRLNRRMMLILATLIPMLCLALFGIFIYTSSRYTPVRAELPPILNNNVSYGDEIPISAKIFGGSPPYNCTWYVNGVLRKHEIINQTGGVSTFEYKANAVGKVSIVFSVTDKRTNSSGEFSLNVRPNTDIDLQIDDEYEWGEIIIRGLLEGIQNDKIVGLADKNVTLRFITKSEEEKRVIKTSMSGSFNYSWVTPQKQSTINITAEFQGDTDFSACACWRIINITKRNTNLILYTNNPHMLIGKLLDKKTNEGVGNAALNITLCQSGMCERLKNIKTNSTGFFSIDFSNCEAANYTVETEFKGDERYNGSKCIINISPDFKIEEFTIKEIKLDEKEIIFRVQLINTGFFNDTVNIMLDNPINMSFYNVSLSISEPSEVSFIWNVKNITGGKYTIRCVVISNITYKKETRQVTINIQK